MAMMLVAMLVLVVAMLVMVMMVVAMLAMVMMVMVVIEIIMAARVVYGLGRRGRLPRVLAQIDPKRRTPLNATLLITAVMLIMALSIPLDHLVSLTSQIILTVFTLVNLSLVVVKWRGDPPPEGIFTVPAIFPAVGVLSCLFLLFGPLLFG